MWENHNFTSGLIEKISLYTLLVIGTVEDFYNVVDTIRWVSWKMSNCLKIIGFGLVVNNFL